MYTYVIHVYTYVITASSPRVGLAQSLLHRVNTTGNTFALTNGFLFTLNISTALGLSTLAVPVVKLTTQC